ncbi:MAG TPA: YlxR family protein [Bacillales bacterium]|nr:YlxR family protein [Bacillales bacterium]
MKKRKIPMRKCVATQEMRPKKELFRIVRTPEGEVLYDPSGKKSGRGTYLSKDKEAIERARKHNILAKHLNADVDDHVYEELLDIVAKEQRA